MRKRNAETSDSHCEEQGADAEAQHDERTSAVLNPCACRTL